MIAIIITIFLLILLCIISTNYNTETFKTKCFSCEKQMPQVGHPSKCFSCEKMNNTICNK